MEFNKKDPYLHKYEIAYQTKKYYNKRMQGSCEFLK